MIDVLIAQLINQASCTYRLLTHFSTWHSVHPNRLFNFLSQASVKKLQILLYKCSLIAYFLHVTHFFLCIADVSDFSYLSLYQSYSESKIQFDLSHNFNFVPPPRIITVIDPTTLPLHFKETLEPLRFITVR